MDTLTAQTQYEQAERLRVTRDALLVTYDPESNQLSIDPLGTREVSTFIRCFTVATDDKTGATFYILDRTYHTCASVAKNGTFSFSATSHYEPNVGAINGPKNVKAFEQWLRDLGDNNSAEEVKFFFPAVFAPPAPMPAKKRRSWWLW
jgi:hypothetical protein